MIFIITKTEKNKRIIIAVILCLILIWAVGVQAVISYSQQQASVETLSKFGSTGNEVRQIQTKLKSLGYYNGSVDGIYGNQTKNAVIAFQKKRGLQQDGIAGPKTLSALGITSSSGSSKYSTSDINLLAKVISGESRGESYTGQVAVGAVVLNRTAHSSFPDTVSGVVYQPGAFSCVYDSNWYAAVAASANQAARDSINGWDPTGGAIYYYNAAKTTNKWMLSRPKIITIGKHVFCK
ncbi:MAG: spore cortex-lytic enzyme [Oscillospiraceae bacterium]|jgi:N-acetylmuramoyl-L-alanine amidase|nr:spore cortex-lytic enzyme [Oscillospiraceae bacterium]